MTVSVPVYLVAVTNIHSGYFSSATEASDLPVEKDYLNIPIIDGDALKGALSQTVFNTPKDFVKEEKAECVDEDAYRKKVRDAIFGDENHIGLIGVSRFNLLAIPISENDTGLIYLTSPILLWRAAQTLRFHDAKLAAYLAHLAQKASMLKLNEAITSKDGDIKLVDTITLKNVECKNCIKMLVELLKKVQREALGWSPIEHVAAVSDDTLAILLNKALIIKPGVHLTGLKKIDNVLALTKNVEHGPWFEEEVPKFSIFVGTIFSHRNVKIRLKKEELIELLNLLEHVKVVPKDGECEVEIDGKKLVDKLLERNVLFVGGRESIGRGLVKLVKHQPVTETDVEETKGPPAVKTDIAPYQKGLDEAKICLSEIIEEYKGRKVESELVSKFSSLPDRLNRVGLLPTLLFYKKVKISSEEESRGKGYKEVVEALEKLLRKLNLDIESIDSNALLLYYYAISWYVNRLKYIIRTKA